MTRRALVAIGVVIGSLALTAPAHAGYDRTFPTGSLIVPMDLTYQDHGMLQAYGLVFQLLRQGVRVYWVIDPDKTWHDAPCDTVGDECAWDCEEEGSGLKCPYPTASPDFFAAATIVWDGEGDGEGSTITRHGYRGGPFVIDAADAATARAIVDAWNDPTQWAANPWAERTEFAEVSVHETTAPFDGYVRKEMIAAPTIAVFSDGNEDIATGYLRAAGIPQSSGAEFPAARCGAGTCGPGTANPDMLTVESIMGDMGTCDAPNLDHRNGALFTDDGVPAFCQIMSMHWAVTDRETVQCEGGCPATQAECTGRRFTYHGHEVVAEVREFLSFPTHFFAECQAVNAYENTVPNPAWPYLDDEGRRGHFLTTEGTPPDCPCTDGDFQCVTGGCDGGTRDCCLPRALNERGAGFLIAAQPNSDTLQILHPDVPYNQMDGAFQTVGGSEPAYNLSTYLGSTYIGDADVTFITGPSGPGDQDVWMTGYLDGVCDIGFDEFETMPTSCNLGKVSYLGGHRYQTSTPISANEATQGTRMFLNALFEADCVTSAAQPVITLSWSGRNVISPSELPIDEPYTVRVSNTGRGAALDAVLTVRLPDPLDVVSPDAGGTVTGREVSWSLGSIGASGSTAPPASVMRALSAHVAAAGTYTLQAGLTYRVGASTMTQTAMLEVAVADGVDGGGIGSDAGPRDGGGGAFDAGTGGPGGSSGCGCRAGGGSGAAGLGSLLAVLALVLARRRVRR